MLIDRDVQYVESIIREQRDEELVGYWQQFEDFVDDVEQTHGIELDATAFASFLLIEDSGLVHMLPPMLPGHRKASGANHTYEIVYALVGSSRGDKTGAVGYQQMRHREKLREVCRPLLLHFQSKHRAAVVN